MTMYIKQEMVDLVLQQKSNDDKKLYGHFSTRRNT